MTSSDTDSYLTEHNI